MMAVIEPERMSSRDILDDHPSLSASLEDFEHNGTYSEHNRAPLLPLPSHHSGFARSEDGESSIHSDSGSAFLPPGERRFGPGSVSASGLMGWSKHRPYQQDLRPASMLASRVSIARAIERNAPEDIDGHAAEVRLAANVRLPSDSPIRRSPSPSPAPPEKQDEGIRPRQGSAGVSSEDAFEQLPPTDAVNSSNNNNYFRLAVRAEVHHRTEPVEAAINYVRKKYNALTRSRASTFGAVLSVLFAIALVRLLIQPPPPPPVPDLVKVAGLARSFEPLIYYSENGVQQIGDLQETGVAVWDLSESMRTTNMTSAPLIVQELDELSENLKSLALELTRFFASVDGDVDGILIVMEWAKRELSRLSSSPPKALAASMDNLHTVLCRVGLFETAAGEPTTVGRIFTDLFGQSYPQRTRSTLQRTFNEFLAVLEESINTELTHSTALFGLFESIDAQFLNLARTVIRESDQQEREEGALLASLWARVLGPNADRLRKFEKNRLLLASVRQKTLLNKHLLVDHNGKLLTLKASLETLRKKLVSPLVRANDSSTLSVEEQISGLDGTYEHLRAARERQKQKLREVLFGAGARRTTLERHLEGYAIES